ncbi:MAG: hypothetical protein ACK52I_07990 [Pseudomonadota bacterium]
MALTRPNLRQFLADVPQIDMTLPVAANVFVYEGAFLMWGTAGNAGTVQPVSGAGQFAGIALQTIDNTGGAAGAVAVRVRLYCGIEANVAGGDTPTIGSVGVASSVPAATDDDTVRIETASLITGTAPGNLLRVIEDGTANGKVALHVRAAQVA